MRRLLLIVGIGAGLLSPGSAWATYNKCCSVEVESFYNSDYYTCAYQCNQTGPPIFCTCTTLQTSIHRTLIGCSCVPALCAGTDWDTSHPCEWEDEYTLSFDCGSCGTKTAFCIVCVATSLYPLTWNSGVPICCDDDSCGFSC